MKSASLIKRFVVYTMIFFAVQDVLTQEVGPGGDYTVVVEGYDWGPAVNKVILPVEGIVSEVNREHYLVTVARSTEGIEMQPGEARGSRQVVYAYVSDEKGNKVAKGNYVTLTLFVGPDHVPGSPIKYVRVNNRGSNLWIDYKMTITDTLNNKVWDREKARIRPGIDKFDLGGSYKHGGDLTLSYAAFTPDTDREKYPLIIWLHGGGEGGTDPSIPLIANKAANYASEEIQVLFGGAYVLAPQCPGAWMHNAEGVSTHGREDDIYNEGLMALIRDYVAANPKIDTGRIYVGGCSNGGYMALKLILLDPGFFAAGYISALAYQSQYIADEQIDSIKNVPIWFVHSAADQTTIPDKTVLPVYRRLIAAGARDVHLSFYDHVIDLTGFYGGDDYYYNGHWSWIYSHANHADFDYNGMPVLIGDRPVTIMEWMAAKSN
ncbi:MAG TPA: hypothetical protein VKN36_14520 [Eudoraea sp.]|nr:hypothetical protein [Eudoraea sp.]